METTKHVVCRNYHDVHALRKQIKLVRQKAVDYAIAANELGYMDIAKECLHIVELADHDLENIKYTAKHYSEMIIDVCMPIVALLATFGLAELEDRISTNRFIEETDKLMSKHHYKRVTIARL